MEDILTKIVAAKKGEVENFKKKMKMRLPSLNIHFLIECLIL